MSGESKSMDLLRQALSGKAQSPLRIALEEDGYDYNKPNLYDPPFWMWLSATPKLLRGREDESRFMPPMGGL